MFKKMYMVVLILMATSVVYSGILCLQGSKCQAVAAFSVGKKADAKVEDKGPGYRARAQRARMGAVNNMKNVLLAQ